MPLSVPCVSLLLNLYSLLSLSLIAIPCKFAPEVESSSPNLLSLLTFLFGVSNSPPIYTQASKDPKRCEDMVQEFNALITEEAWDLVPSKPGQNLAGYMWVC